MVAMGGSRRSSGRGRRTGGSGRPGQRARGPQGSALIGGLLRGLAFGVLVVVALFVWFVMTLPGPAPLTQRTDAVVVLTGGPGRVARGIEVLQAQAAGRLLISGVDRKVKPRELAVEVGAPKRLFDCCIDLGFEAVNTRSNADETANWVRRNRYRSVRLITSADHMARARLELEAELGKEVVIVSDAVPRDRSLDKFSREFGKYLLRTGARLVGM